MRRRAGRQPPGVRRIFPATALRRVGSDPRGAAQKENDERFFMEVRRFERVYS